ncbi:MAG: hypothetical protein CM15mP77_3130 [Synechococcus sp.]|nr:MAG: hypothetical protein CM15mP77_3130 [Synechococcus sp.]
MKQGNGRGHRGRHQPGSEPACGGDLPQPHVPLRECDRSDRRGRPLTHARHPAAGSGEDPAWPGTELQQGAALIESGVLSGFDDEARTAAARLGVQATAAPSSCWLRAWWTPHGSALTDQRAHRNHPQPASLRCRRGYGQVALLPRGKLAGPAGAPDRPAEPDPSSVHLPLWEASAREDGEELAPTAICWNTVRSAWPMTMPCALASAGAGSPAR